MKKKFFSKNMSLILFGSLFLFRCQQPIEHKFGDINKTDFIDFLNKNKITLKPKKYIVIPNAGCTGCISDAEKEFKETYQNADNLYIFTGISDLKLFSNSLPKNALKSKNVIVDTNNVLISIGFNSIYPSIIELNNSQKVTITPFNN